MKHITNFFQQFFKNLQTLSFIFLFSFIFSFIIFVNFIKYEDSKFIIKIQHQQISKEEKILHIKSEIEKIQNERKELEIQLLQLIEEHYDNKQH